MPVPLPRPTKDAVLCFVLETRSSIPKGPKCQQDRIQPITGEARRSARGPCSSHDLSWTPSVTGLSLRAAPPVRLRCLGRESIPPAGGGEAQNKCSQDQGGIWKVVSCRKPVKSYTIGEMYRSPQRLLTGTLGECTMFWTPRKSMRKSGFAFRGRTMEVIKYGLKQQITD